MLRRTSSLALAFVLFLGHTSYAEDAVNPAARQRYQRAAQAYQEGHYKDAIDMFLDAARLAPNPAYSYNIGLAYEQLGDAPNALRWFREYLRDLPNAPDRAEIEPRITVAEAHLRELGVQQVSVLSTPAGATLTLDGRRVGVTPWTGELSPGKHRAALEMRGFADTEQSFDLPSDRALDVTLTMPVDDKANAAATAPILASTPQAAERDRAFVDRINPLTWATLGVGVAGLAVATGFELARSSAESDAKGSSTNSAGHEAYDTAKSRETAARIAVGVGGALVAVGGVLLYFDLSGRTGGDDPRKTALGLGCTGALCGANFKGAF